MSKDKRGFTLIELLVVMGILGILMAVTILVINPAQYLARARDTQRINDLQAINSAVSIALANGELLTSTATSDSGCVATISGASTIACVGATSAVPAVGDRKTDGSGWVKGINISASMGTLPIDPTNSGNYYYLWANNGTNYEIDANAIESTYYTSSPNDVRANDGGNNLSRYEVGSSLIAGMIP